MSNLAGKIGALAAGALAMYYLDPQMGPQRRAALLDLVNSSLRNRPARGVPMQVRMKRRTYDLAAAADPQSDAELRDRIRNRLGRMVSHPRGIDVRVENGVVRLSGDVLAKERDGLLLQVQEMPGVQKLVNAMTAHEGPGIGGLEQPVARETAAA
jgi:osmotically-inducible protein OsmY